MTLDFSCSAIEAAGFLLENHSRAAGIPGSSWILNT
jgi:hypothetical protein